MLRRCALVVGGFFVVLAFSSMAFAQGGRAEINGTVYDQDKAVMPGVSITVTSDDTGLVRTTVSSGDGRFVVPTLVPGLYTVQAELQGFQTATQAGLRLAVGQELTLALTLQLAGIAENLTVTAQAPIVEVTASQVGTNITTADIDSLPAAGRNQLSLMQMVPGLVPSLNPGDFEGGQFNANGQTTTANVFMTDGAYNNDSRRGGSQGTQSAVSLDTMAEYQVLTHHYTAEYGGGTGVIVNTVTRGGTNNFSGRAFEYFKDEKLDAIDYRNRGGEKTDYISNVFGGNIGGPVIRNKWFFFGNMERTLRKDPAILTFPDGIVYPAGTPAGIAPVSYNDTIDFTVMNTFVRTDVQMSANHNLSVRYNRAHELTEKDTLAGSTQTISAQRHENDAGDQVFSAAFTSVLGNHATNEFRVARVTESLLQAGRLSFDEEWNFIGLDGKDQFDFGGSVNNHPDYTTNNTATMSSDLIRDFTVDDSFTFLKGGLGGDHTFKLGFSWGTFGARPQTIGGNAVGTFAFPTNAAFDPAVGSTYPWQFTIRVLGQLDYDQIDHKTAFYFQDKWQVNPKFTFNYGVRYDYQTAVEQQKAAFAPRFGIAWDPTGSGTTVVRAGIGQYYQLQSISVIATLQTAAIHSPINQFDTGSPNAATSPAVTGVPLANPCLQPIGNGTGVALISPACKNALVNTRAQVAAGTFINRDPTVEGDRTLPYIWAWSAGVKRQLMADLAVSVDYTANRGYDNTTLLDINVGPSNAAGVITRLGVNGFDPNGEIIPFEDTVARAFTYRRVLQYVTDERFNNDFNSVEVALDKRMSNRWSARVAYTLGKANDVGGITDNLNPRNDYGRASTDNRHALAMSANVDVWKGLSAGGVFRTYLGYPINETIGSDANGDNNNNDRPLAGKDDATIPIKSPLDANGRAIRNGIDGEKTTLLDARAQYIWSFGRTEAGIFLELYNVLNTVNFGNSTGNRTSAGFGNNTLSNVGNMRKTQLGFRVTF